MWPDFYQMGTVGLGRKPPLELGHGVYVLIETLGTDPESDQARYESVIGEAIEAGVVQDAIIAQSQREATELWAVRDSPGEWSKGIHWPQLGFDVSVPTGEIGPLAEEIGAELKRRWPELIAVFFGHVADGNLHVSVRMSGHSIPELEIEDAVYGIVAQAPRLHIGRTRHRLAEDSLPAFLAQRSGDRADARHQAGHGSRRAS